MAEQRYSLFVDKNPYVQNLVKKFELPLSDKSIYINGRLENSQFTDEEINQLNLKIIQGRKSLYGKDQIVVESVHTPQVEFTLLEEGQYYIQVSSAGGRGRNLNRFVGTWNINNIDEIIIYPQNSPQKFTSDFGEEYFYTWERTKDFDDKKTTWKGTYTYLNDTVFLSLLLLNDLKAVDNIVYNTEDYGILMLKKDIFELEKPYKLYPWRNDDTIDDIEYKYAGPLTTSDFIQSAKGEDGKFFNEIITIPAGEKLFYKIGQGGQIENASGGDSQIIGITSLTGGSNASNFNDFGGRGGNFVYDYYGRTKYELPEDGRLLLLYTGHILSSSFKLNVTKDSYIINESYPKNEITPATIVTLKVKLESGYEIDYENSTINDISLEKYVDKIHVNNFLKDVHVSLTEIDYYQIQTITFPMPLQNTNIKLVSKKIKYKITITSSYNSLRYIEECKISNGEDDGDLLKGDFYTETNKQIIITLRYIDSSRMVDKDVLAYYLCLDPNSIIYSERDPNNCQTITFPMPARNLLLRIEIDSLLTLTIEKNIIQEIEQKRGIHNRPIEKIILIEYGKPEKPITYFPYRIQVKYRTLFDIYIKYSDIYQHIDKELIYSQVPNVLIEEAGEFNLDNTPIQILPKEMTEEQDG